MLSQGKVDGEFVRSWFDHQVPDSIKTQQWKKNRNEEYEQKAVHIFVPGGLEEELSKYTSEVFFFFAIKWCFDVSCIHV